MLRKKSGKKNNSTSMLQKLEMEFKQTPNKLLVEVNKEMSALKQKDIQIKNQIAKLSAQFKNAESRLANALKNKGAASKKQAAQAKKTCKELTITLSDLSKQANANTKSQNDTKIKQARVNALRKYLADFDKTWSKQAKQLIQKLATEAKKAAEAQAKKALKAKAKKAKKAKSNHVAKAYKQPVASAAPQQSVENYNDSLENTTQHETTEAEMA